MIFPTTLPELSAATTESATPAPPAPVRPATKGLLAHIADARRERLTVEPPSPPAIKAGNRIGLLLALTVVPALVIAMRPQPTTSPRHAVVTREDAFGCMHLSVLRRIGSLTTYDADVDRESARDCVSFSKGERLAVKQQSNGFVRAQRQGDEASYWLFMGYIRLEDAP